MLRRRRITLHALALLPTATVGLLLLPSSARAQAPEAMSADQTVNRLLSLRHGIAWLGPDEQELLDAVKARPGDYVSAIREALKLPVADAALAEDERIRRVSVAVMLAREVGGEHGRDLVWGLLREAANRLEEYQSGEAGKTRHGEAHRNLLLLRIDGLKAMALLNDSRAVGYCLTVLPNEEDNSTRFVMVRQYIPAVARGRADVKQRLTEILRDPKSRVYDDPDVRRTIAELDQPPPAQATTQATASQPSTAPTVADLDRMLSEAKAAWSRKDYAAAEQLAQDVLKHPRATDEQKRQAQLILDRVAESRGEAPASQPAAPPASQPSSARSPPQP